MSAPASGIFSSLFSSLGEQVASSPDVTAAENAATQAFYAIAGELLILIILQLLLLARMWDRRG